MGRLDLVDGIKLWDVSGAIDVPGLDRDANGTAERLSPGGWRHRREQVLVVLDDCRLSPDFQPLPLAVIHEEQLHPRIFAEIAEGDILLVPLEIRKSQGLAVDDRDEAGRPAAMLDVRLCVGGGCRQIEGDAA